MLYRNFWIGLVLVITLVGSAAAAGISILRHEPNFYTRVAISEGDQRVRLSQEFVTDLGEFMASIAADRDWFGQFSQSAINGALQEGLATHGLQPSILPEVFEDPRVEFQGDALKIGVRYRFAGASVVLSAQVRMWLAREVPNAVVIEFQKFQAGSMPLPFQGLLDQIADSLRQAGVDVHWYRHGGQSVAVLSFGAEKARPEFQIVDLRIQNGKLVIRGRSPELEGPIVGPVSAAPSSTSKYFSSVSRHDPMLRTNFHQFPCLA